MTSEALRLRTALVAVFPDYVMRSLEEHGITVDRATVAAIDRGAGWLDTELDALLSAPAAEQDRSPLEVFRSALSFPTEALLGAGVAPVDRDPVAIDLLPDDVYDLAPGGSSQLGDDVRAAQLTWGAAKAKAIAGANGGGAELPDAPLVALVAGVPADRVPIAIAVRAAGFDLELIRNPAALEEALTGRPPALVLVDLAFGIADAAIRAFATSGVRVIAYGDDVDDLGTVRASALGAQRVVETSRFLATVDEHLPRIV
jgi:hypothetical protein